MELNPFVKRFNVFYCIQWFFALGLIRIVSVGRCDTSVSLDFNYRRYVYVNLF